MSLYLSDWKPRGAKKSWERNSMELKSTMQFIGDLPPTANWGEPIEAVAWFDEYGEALRILVVDYPQNRLTMRFNGRNRILQFARKSA